MKFLVIVSACLAVSTAHVLPIAGIYGGFHGPLADVVPGGVAGLVAHPNGAVTPAETPSVLAARRDHLIAKDAAYAAAGPYLAAAPAVPAFAAGPVVAAAPALGPAQAFAPFPAVAPFPAIGYAGYVGPLADHLPAGAAGLVGHPNGAVTPADTPSVVAARRDHLIAKDAAYAAAGPALAYAGGYGYGAVPALGPAPAFAAGLGYGAVPAFAGAPAIAAPAFAAPAVGPIPSVGYAAGYGYGGVIPVGAGSPTGALVSFPNGAVVPADEPAVVAARAEHFAAKGGLGW